MNTKRTPAGIPTGGEFAANEHDEASVSLDGFLHTGGDKTVVEVVESKATDAGVEFTPDGADEPIEVFTDRSPVSYMDTKVERRADGNYDISYASYDEDHTDYDFMEGDSLETFRSMDDRNAYIQTKIDEGVPRARIFVADRMEHGQVKYTVLDQENEDQPLDRWDSAPSTVIVVDEKGESGIEPENYRAAADAIAEDYTSWSNGEVYALSRSTVDQNGDIVENEETIYGFVSTEYAEQSIKSGEF